MTRVHRLLPSAALLLVSMHVACAVTIVVSPGPFQSPGEAALAEDRVTWHDPDPADDIACTQCFAALELQAYLREMTGRSEDFALSGDAADPGGDIILVGGPDTNRITQALANCLRLTAAELVELGPEGYILRSANHNGRRVLAVAGGGRVGTLYGAYDLLHRLGVRWYAPGKVNQEVSSIKLTSLPELDVSETPAFYTRGFHAWENRGDDEFILWMARNRMNYWCVEQDNKPLLHKLGIMLVGGGHVLTSYYLNPHNAYPYNHTRFTGDETKPADPYPVTDAFLGDANADGKLTYFEAHPEWYALIDGKRSDKIHGDGGDNFCTSNPHAMTEWMKHAVEDLAEGRYKDAGIMNAWMLDGGRWCQCDGCKALGTPTDRNILFVHEYDRAIKRAQAERRINRTVRLLFLAYADVLQPPTRPLPADFDYETCIATYFPIARCYVHEFTDPACGRNASYNRHLQGWAVQPDRHYQGQVCIGEYYNVSGYKCLPICFSRTMMSDIPYFYSRGARHFHYMHCTTRNWGNKALTNWQMARQLWDSDADCGVLWNDYFSGRYGPAHSRMRDFYANLEWMLCNVTELKYGLSRRLENGAANLFPTSHLHRESLTPPVDAHESPAVTLYERDAGPGLDDSLRFAANCRAILDEVLAMELPERVRARVEEDERLFTYGQRTLQFYDALVRTYDLLRAGEGKQAFAAYDEAKSIAKLLEADKTSPAYSSSHASAPNALVASYAAGALPTLQMLLGPADPDRLKGVSAGKALTLYGEEFLGGGAPYFGVGLNSFPGKVHVSDHGNYLYARGGRPADRMTVHFRVDGAITGPLKLTLFGILTPVIGVGTVSGQVLVNDKPVFEGNMPFDKRKLTPLEITVPAEALKTGVNSLEIHNTETEGSRGGRPWFGVERVELSF